MATELQDRYPYLRQFKFMVAVNNGFIVSARTTTNNLLRSLQGIDLVDHYTVPLSTSGNFPATFWGANGLVRDREAYGLWVYYNSIARADIDSWVLDSDNMRLWSKADGFLDPPDGPWTYEDFLAATPPVLQIIETPVSETFSYVVTYSPWYLKDFVNSYLQFLTSSSLDFMFQGASVDGTAPAIVEAGSWAIDQIWAQEIADNFPAYPANPVLLYLTDPGGKPYWDSFGGSAPGIAGGVSVIRVLFYFGLKPII